MSALSKARERIEKIATSAESMGRAVTQSRERGQTPMLEISPLSWFQLGVTAVEALVGLADAQTEGQGGRTTLGTAYDLHRTRRPGVTLICDERAIQGYGPAHDDTHDCGELALAAIAYTREALDLNVEQPDDWPWGQDEYRPESYAIGNLVKAGALIAAEIDRRLRAGETIR